MVVNPFVSEAQRRACYAADDPAWDCSEWDKAGKKEGKKPVANAKKKAKNPLRIDPTRTATLRRQATARVRKAFAIIKGKLRKLIIDEDAFGLKERKTFAFNSFCPTGEGGGVDPTCGKDTLGERHSQEIKRLRGKHDDELEKIDAVRDKELGKLKRERERIGDRLEVQREREDARDGTPSAARQEQRDKEDRELAAREDTDPAAVYAKWATIEKEITARHAKELDALIKSRTNITGNEWNPDQPRDEAGRFASMAGGAVAAFHKADGWLKDKVKGNFEKLPQPVQTVVAGGIKAAFTGWTASQALAERVAKEKGLTDEKAAALRGALAAADLIAFKPAAMLAPLLPGGGIATAAMWAVPPVTGAYLLYSSATSPVATYKAASGLVKEALGKLKDKIHGSGPFVTTNNQAVIDALERAGYSDWWLALFCSAGAETGSTDGAIKLANGLFAKHPVTNAYGRFSFHTSPQQIKAFQQWLRQQMAQHIVSEKDKDVWQAYAEAGWRKGAGRAWDDVNQAKLKDKRPELFDPARQAEVQSFYAGTKNEFLRSAFNQPVSVERIQVLAGRTFDDLKNVTEDMATRMSRTLTDGLARGDSPYDVAADLADDLDIGRNRAEVIARTEIIRAHAEGQLDAMENLGVKRVGVMVEILVTDDDKLCDECESLEDTLMTIDEARGVIPVHPGCRCSWTPANVGEDEDED